MELELNTVFRVNWVLKSPSLHFVTIFGATADTAFNFAIINASLGVRVEVLKNVLVCGFLTFKSIQLLVM